MSNNEFVKYLNSMNNASADNIHALAEAQVTNQYYNSIRVNRKLGKYISDSIKDGKKQCFIITGHAGDGKTSILVQILRELDMLNENEKLKKHDVKNKDDMSLMYVKDMSELTESEQERLLKEALEAPAQDRSSVLISNTGPLINSFKKILEAHCDDVEVEDKLLKQMDTNELKPICLHKYEFYLINLARIENIGFVKDIIKKVSSEKLWEDCCSCENKEKCPIYFNVKCINNNKERVISFVEMYYRWLKENDKRMTIRQMLSQICYGITGNLECESIAKKDRRIFNFYRYNFANLFFGFKGIEIIDDALQIKGVRLIQDLELDRIALNEDYDLFIKEDFSCFEADIREVLEVVWKEYLKVVDCDKDAEEKAVATEEIRRSIRRFYLLYSQISDAKNIYKQIYSDVFNEYVKNTTKKGSRQDLKKILKLVFDGLYIKNIGLPPLDEKTLYLTLTRSDSIYQSSLLMLGKANISRFKVEQKKKNIDIEDIKEAYELELKLDGKNEDGGFKLSLPLLLYFDSIVGGDINTEVNSSLSHGLAKLNSILLKCFKNKETSEEKRFSLIVNTVSGTKEIKVELSDDKIYFE